MTLRGPYSAECLDCSIDSYWDETLANGDEILPCPECKKVMRIYLDEEVCYMLAEDEETEPEILKKISDIQVPIIRALIASNPNCQEETLRSMAASTQKIHVNLPINDEDEDDFSNIVEDALSIEELLKTLPDDTNPLVVSFINEVKPSLPSFINGWEIAKRITSTGGRLALARDVDTRHELLDWLAQDNRDYVREAVAGNTSCSVATIVKLVNDSSLRVRVSAVSNSSLPLDIIEKSAISPDASIRCAVAKNRSTPKEILQTLSRESKFKKIRMAVAENPNTSVFTLSELADDRHNDVRREVRFRLGEKDMEEPIDERERDLEKIKTDLKNRDFEYRLNLASNENLSLELITILSKDKRSEVRGTIAVNRATPMMILEELAEDKSAAVRKSVAESSNANQEILQKLMIDEKSYVRAAVGMNANATEEILENLAKDRDWLVQISICRNLSTPEHLLMSVLKKLDYSKCSYLLSEERLRPEIIEYLLRSKDQGIVELVLENTEVPVQLLAQFSESDNSEIRIAVARNLYLTQDMIEKLSRDANPEVRMAIFENESTPPEIIFRLTPDDDIFSQVERNDEFPR